MSSSEFHLGLLDSIFRSVERLCEGELFSLAHIRKVSALCLLYNVYHKVDHPMNGYLNHFVVARNTRASAALGEMTLVTPRCRTGEFTQLFLMAAARMWNLLLSGVFSAGTLSSFRSAMNLCLLRA